MKKLLLSATACLSMVVSIKAQNIQPCGTYQAREIHLKNVPGYAAKLNAAEATADAEYQAYLKNQAAQRTTALPTYTIPVVFHVLHLGSPMGAVGSENISDALCANALQLVNNDYARTGSDTAAIDNLFKPLYVNSNLHFELAKLDPLGNCTNGVIHHYDPRTNWEQSDIFGFQYSTYGAGNWNPSKYMNVYIVKNIIGSSQGIIVGYTYLPGTSPVTAADAIVYRYDFLTGINARSLSHEIGHWFGLSHTFGSTNEAGTECGNDDIADTPKTTGFFSNCPKPANYPQPGGVLNPLDSSDIVTVSIVAANVAAANSSMTSNSELNSLTTTLIYLMSTTAGTATVHTRDTITINAKGTNGGYSDFSDESYPNDIASGTKTLTVKSLASSTTNNYVAVYIDYNRNGSFTNAGEAIYNSSANLTGIRTFTTTFSIPTTPGITRMRVITSSTPITGPEMVVTSGEIEDYMLNLNLKSCDTIRPNIENIMDYSSCPKMFTQGQTNKMRMSAESMSANRRLLSDTANLVFTGLLSKTLVSIDPSTGDTTFAYAPTGPNACAPTADFISNKPMTCATQTISYTSISYNGTPTSYQWEFEGGTPSTSTSTAQIVNYSTPGIYTVALTVSNANGSSTKTSTINVSWNADVITLPYSEDFESANWPPIGWSVKNLNNDDIAWEKTNSYGAQGSTKSAILPNANYNSSPFGYSRNVDVLESQGFDFTNTSALSIAFDYTFARKTGVTTDEFALQYSLDCGGIWTNVIGTPNAQTLATSGGVVNAPYLPASSAVPNPLWITRTISGSPLNNLANKRDVKFRFWFRNDDTGMSQNLYIDNINISGVVSVNELANSIGLAIYPNPTSGSTAVEFTAQKDSKVTIIVYDVTGRVVEESSVIATAGITSKHMVNNSSRLRSGIYFITLEIDNQKVTKKLIIE